MDKFIFEDSTRQCDTTAENSKKIVWLETE